MSGYLRRLAASVIVPPVPLRPLAAGRFLARSAAPGPFAFADRSETSNPPASAGHVDPLLPAPARGPSRAAESRETAHARRSPREAPAHESVAESQARSTGNPAFAVSVQPARLHVDQLLVPLLAERENASRLAAPPPGDSGRRTSAGDAIDSRAGTAAPFRAAARGFGEPAAADTTVHVHIGRIDVRALTPPAAAALPTARAKAESLLDAHLRARDGGRP